MKKYKYYYVIDEPNNSGEWFHFILRRDANEKMDYGTEVAVVEVPQAVIDTLPKDEQKDLLTCEKYGQLEMFTMTDELIPYKNKAEREAKKTVEQWRDMVE